MLVIGITPKRAATLGISLDADGRTIIDAVMAKRPFIGVRVARERYLSVVIGELGITTTPSAIVTIAPAIIDGAWTIGEFEMIPSDSNLYDAEFIVQRNPVRYDSAPGEPQRTCACGCDASVTGKATFKPGHDQKALHERIDRYFGGSVITALEELDRVFGP